MSGVPARIVNERAYAAAREAALAHLTAMRGYVPPERQLETLTRAVTEAYQAALTAERMTNQRIAPSTRAMAELAVGEVAMIDCAARVILHRNMKTARRLMSNPRARWAQHETTTGVIRVTRMPDGSQPKRDPWANVRAVQLAAIHVGKARICSAFPTVHALCSNTKVAARRLLDNHEANWSARTTSHGVRITRTA